MNIIGRKLITSNSQKLQPLLNVSKAWQTIPDGFIKNWEPSKKHPKNNQSLVTEVEETTASSVVKPREKQRTSESTIRKLLWKINNLKLNKC